MTWRQLFHEWRETTLGFVVSYLLLQVAGLDLVLLLLLALI